MKKGYSHVTFILDNSGSMAGLKPETISGYNTFLAKQKADPGTMTFSLYQFTTGGLSGYAAPAPNPIIVGGIGVAGPNFGVNHFPMVAPYQKGLDVQCNYDFIDVQNVPSLNDETYQCITGTPLLDAIGTALEATGIKLAAMDEKSRPEKVFFVILTDGQELHSKKFTKPVINEMITHQREAYKWDFIFLGANQDAIQTGTSYGVSAASSMTYGATVRGMSATYDALSATVSASKASGLETVFSNAARTEALDGK